MAKASKKDINLYTLVVGPKKHTVKTGLIIGIIGVAALVIMGGTFAGLRVYANIQEAKVAELEEKTNDPVLKEKLEHVNEVMEQISILRAAGDVYKEVRLDIMQSEAYCDDFTLDLVDKLRSCEKGMVMNEEVIYAEITALAYSGDVLQITAESTDSRNISRFVDRLNDLGLFASISYDGYSFQEEVGYVYTVNAVFYEHVYEMPEETTEKSTEASTEAAEEGTVS